MESKGNNKSTIARRVVARPFLKWVGGKGKIVDQIMHVLPEGYNRYFEPFVGGGALLFALKPESGHISDTNVVLMEAFGHVKENATRVISELKTLQDQYWALPDLEAKKDFYLEKREVFNSLSNDDFEKTVLLIFLNKTCFNGMYRENSRGEFNVPFGKHERPTICDEDNIEVVSRQLQKITMSTDSYELAVESASKGDLIYFDPPYHPLNVTSSFTDYQAGGFKAKDQEKLRDTFKMLSDRGCFVVLSNSYTPLILELYKDFNLHEIYAARSINSKGAGRGKIKELLITNY